MDSDKQKALDAALAQIDRAFGKGRVERFLLVTVHWSPVGNDLK